jgi:hypothetical protein
MENCINLFLKLSKCIWRFFVRNNKNNVYIVMVLIAVLSNNKFSFDNISYNDIQGN